MIQFVDLKRSHKPIRKKIDQAIKRVIDDCQFILSNHTTKFEKEFAEYIGVKYGIGVNSGTDALRLAIEVLGIGPGDEVITQVNTFTATVDAIYHSGAKPVLIDCDDYFGIDIDQIEGKITKRTKAILPVHLYGQMANMDKIKQLSSKYGLYIIEDAAQAHGALWNGKKAGSFGDIACFSFYPAKNLGALGDGGMLLTNSNKIAEKLIKLRNLGMKKKYHHELVGYNSRLDSLQAAVLSVKLKYLDKWNDQRRQAAKLYDRLLKGVETPKEHPLAKHIYHIYPIKTPKRKALQEFLEKKGIITLIHYPFPIHLQQNYRHLGYKKGDFPKAEANAKQELSLPMFPGITEKEIREVANSISQFFK